MIALRYIFPKCTIEPSWDRLQVARALRKQRKRKNFLLKTAQVLEQWATESPCNFDARDYEIIAAQIRSLIGEPRGADRAWYTDVR